MELKIAFFWNFVAIITSAVAIDLFKHQLVRGLVVSAADDGPECATALQMIWVMNTLSVGYSSACNAYAYSAARSMTLTLIGLALVTNLLMLLFLAKRVATRVLTDTQRRGK